MHNNTRQRIFHVRIHNFLIQPLKIISFKHLNPVSFYSRGRYPGLQQVRYKRCGKHDLFEAVYLTCFTRTCLANYTCNFRLYAIGNQSGLPLAFLVSHKNIIKYLSGG